jgi:hypothetical protein
LKLFVKSNSADGAASYGAWQRSKSPNLIEFTVAKSFSSFTSPENLN